MAGVEKQVASESNGDTQLQITEHLKEDGLNPTCNDADKLSYLWRLYKHVQSDLKSAHDAEALQRQAQTEEMKEVENYVEHIRKLSDEREALIQELEAENDTLKGQITLLNENEISEEIRKETAEMLTLQGLEEIAESSGSEQIAFLLVERARLLDELEAEQTRSQSDDKNDELKQILDRERTEFEEELQQLRENEKKVRHVLKSEHEEEIGALMDENDKLEKDLNNAKEKVKGLEVEVVHLTRVKVELQQELDKKSDVKKEDSISESPRRALSRSASDVSLRKIIEEKTKIEGELIPLRSKIRVLENEIDNKETELRKSKADVDRGLMLQQQLQLKNKNLRSEMEELEQQLDDAESSVEKLSASKGEITTKMTVLQNEIKELKSISVKADTLEDVVDILKGDKVHLTESCASMKRYLEEARDEQDELASQNELISQKIEDLTVEVDTYKETLDVTNKQVQELGKEKEDLLVSQEEQSKELTVLRQELKTLEESKCLLVESSETMTKENKELTNQIEHLKVEIQKKDLSHSQEVAKHEIIGNHLKEQNEKLSDQLTNMQTNLNDVKVNENTLLHTQKSLLSSNEDLEKKYKQEMDDITAKLQLTLSELTKTRTTLEGEQSENLSLSDKLSASASRLQEIEHIKSLLDQERKAKSDIEVKVQGLEMKVAERSVVADGFEDERKHRIELEKKVFDFNNVEMDLATAKERLDQERALRNDLEGKVIDLEQIVDDQRMDHENLQHSMGNKIKSLENRVQALQDDLFNAQDELQVGQEKYEQIEAELELARSEVKVQTETINELNTLPDVPTRDVGLSRTSADVDNDLDNSNSQDIKDLEVDLELSNVKLQETFGALQTSSYKVSQLQQDLKSSNLKVEELEQKCHNAEKAMQKTEAKLSETTKELYETTSKLDVARSQLDNSIKKVSDTLHDRDSYLQELDMLRVSSQYGVQERQKHLDRLKTIEDVSRQLELDNRQMALKLSETIAKCGKLEDDLHSERQRGTEKHTQNTRYIQQLENDLDIAREQNRQLREELHMHQTQVFKLEADGVGQSAKYESAITRLEMELKEVKMYHKKELEGVVNKHENVVGESRELRTHLRDREQELLKRQSDTLRVKSSTDRLEAQLATEIKLRSDHENRNHTLDQEMTKIWSQVRTLMEKNAKLSISKRTLEEELDKKNLSNWQAQEMYAKTTTSQEAAFKSMQHRTESAERKAEKLQRELQDVSVKMHCTEQNLSDVENIRYDFNDNGNLVSSLRSQLDTEKLQRSLLGQTMEELKHQVSILKKRETKVIEDNHELQHNILDLQACIDNLQDKNDSAYKKQQQLSDVGKKTLLEQITRLQGEVKQLQYELLSTNEKRGQEEKRYEDRKLRTKEKLLKARDFYSRERSRMNDQMLRLDEDLNLTRSTLRKEIEWKEKMDINYKHLLGEKRELISQMTETEDVIREQSRSLTMLQTRTKCLEEENVHHLDYIESLTQQKMSLDRALRELRDVQDSDVSRAVTTAEHPGHITRNSCISNGVDVDWDHDDHLSDAVLTIRDSSSHINTYLSRTYTGDVINLYSGRNKGSEEADNGHQECDA